MTCASKWTAFVCVMVPAWCAAACAGDEAVTLPESWNTLHHRRIAIDIFARATGATAAVRPLQGIDGAPLARHADLPDLELAYWDRPSGVEDPDGAHIDVVRVRPETCELALDGMYLGGEAVPQRFDFDALDAHLESVQRVRGEGALLAIDVSAPGQCGDGAADPFETALADPATWAEAALSVVRHAVGDRAWEPEARPRPIAGVQLFRLAAGADEERALALFARAARRLDEVLPDVVILSPEIAVMDVDDATSGALWRFLAWTEAEAVPLDVVSVALRGDAREAARVVTAVVERAEALGLDVEVALTRLDLPELALPYPADSALGLAHLGAAEMATRIALQPLPVRWMLSGWGPWRPPGAASPDAPLDEAALLATPYFARDGAATQAFVLRMPMRQVAGEQRVGATTDAGEPLAVLASLDEDDGVLSVIIAQPATASGVARITYDLDIPEFALPAFSSVTYRLAVLDQSNRGVPSFFFSDLGTLETEAGTGDVRFRRTLPVPGVHFIEIDRPRP